MSGGKIKAADDPRKAFRTTAARGFTQHLRDLWVRDGWIAVHCSGEAHSAEVGGMIDNCGVCLHYRWGILAVRAWPALDEEQQRVVDLAKSTNPKRWRWIIEGVWRCGGSDVLTPDSAAVLLSLRTTHGPTWLHYHDRVHEPNVPTDDAKDGGR